MLASFIDNIGEQLVDSHDSQDADMAWETPEHVEAEDLTAIGIEEASNTIELVDSENWQWFRKNGVQGGCCKILRMTRMSPFS